MSSTKKKRAPKPESAASAPEDVWLVCCNRCDKPKAPRGCVPVKDSEAKDYCMRSCPGYEEWPQPSEKPAHVKEST